MLKRKLFLFGSMLLLAASAAAGETQSPEIVFSGFPTDIWAAKVSLKFTGLSILENKETSLETELRGGWLTQYSYYNGSFTQREVPVSNFDYTDAEFKTAFIQNKLGIKQVFLSRRTAGPGLIEGFFYMKNRIEGHYDSGGNDPWFTNLADNPERDSIFQTSFIAGTAYNNSARNRHGIIKGINSQLTLEYAPQFINSTADYYCYIFEIQGYMPLLDIKPDEKSNTFSLYIADRIRTAYNDGDYRPYSIRYENSAAVRGIERERFDSRFTAVNNLELRINLPSLLSRDIKPGILAYIDSGYYYEDSSYNGTIFSTGAGIYLDLFGYFQGGIRYDYLLEGTRMDETSSSIDAMLTFYF